MVQKPNMFIFWKSSAYILIVVKVLFALRVWESQVRQLNTDKSNDIVTG